MLLHHVSAVTLVYILRNISDTKSLLYNSKLLGTVKGLVVRHHQPPGNCADLLLLSELVHENFFKFDRDWRNYKTDTIKKTAKTEEAFNEERLESEERVKEFPYNDSWSK